MANKTANRTGRDRNVVVIGAGIIGVATSIWLQRFGYQVVLVDRKGVASGATYGNGGILAACSIIPVAVPGIVSKIPAMWWAKDGPLFLRWRYLPRFFSWAARYLLHANEGHIKHVAAALTPLLHDSLKQHQQLAQGTKADRWLKPSDYLYIYSQQSQREGEKALWQLRREMGYAFKDIQDDDVAHYLGTPVSDYRHAVCLPDHGYITDPGEYVKDLAAHFQAQGGSIVVDEVTEFKKEDNQIVAVQSLTNEWRASHVVVAGGVWSGPLVDMLGFHVPMESERGYHIELYDPSIMPQAPLMVAPKKCVITPMDGRVRCAGLVEFAGLDAPPNPAAFDMLLRALKDVYPDITYTRMETWMGHRPSLTDSLPVIGRHPMLANVFLGFGHHHVGLTGGAKTGYWLASLINNQIPNVDLSAFAIDRFSR